MKLEVEFRRIENSVIGKVIKQEGIERGEFVIKNDNEYLIASGSHPSIGDKYLFIKGTDTNTDNTSFNYDFSTKKDAIEWIKNIKLLIKEVNKDIGYKLQTDEPVWVRDFDYQEWEKAYFAVYIPNSDYPYSVFNLGRKQKDSKYIEQYEQIKKRGE